MGASVIAFLRLFVNMHCSAPIGSRKVEKFIQDKMKTALDIGIAID